MPMLLMIAVTFTGIGTGQTVLALPGLLCAVPLAIFWAGYAIGRQGGGFRSPIVFGDKPQQPARQVLTQDEQRILERYHQQRQKTSRSTSANSKVKAEFSE